MEAGIFAARRVLLWAVIDPQDRAALGEREARAGLGGEVDRPLLGAAIAPLNLTWQPSDPSAEALASIGAWIAAERLENVLPPLNLDVTAESWPIERADAVIAINMVHISHWAATLGLLRHAGALLPAGSPLFLYGPYQRENEALAPSNAAFDADLRARNPAWGLCCLEDVTREAEAVGLKLDRVVAMPANNLSVIFVRT
ncbi:MAG: DUF938 domain-containing protein [Sphingomonas sp.]|nr:DUF938 domain-containing protein [Sphingomonas sp.]